MQRYPALDALRGLAALAVMAGHHLNVLPALYPPRQGLEGWAGWLTYSPLHLLWAGGEAVILFFVLSGFVLSLGVWRGRPLDMQVFIPRRIWRIWVPFMVAVTLAWACAALIGRTPVKSTSEWYAAIWGGAGWTAYLQHALLLGGGLAQSQVAFLPVVWSLRWEMWGSLLLPGLLLLARLHPAVLLAGYVLLLFTPFRAGEGELMTGLLTYLPLFVIGAALARHRERVAAWVAGLSAPMRPILLLAALLLIPAHWYRYPVAGWQLPYAELAVTVGVSLLIVLALGWQGMQHALDHDAVQWLGRVSYSLYLYHALVLTVVVRLGAEWLPIPALLALSFALGLLVAHFAYEWVERPILEYLSGKRRQRLVLSPD